MIGSSKSKTSVYSIWFGLLLIYIITGYFAQGVLLPSNVNSLILYGFLAYSVFAIIYSGGVKLTPILYWELIYVVLSFIAMLYSPSFSIFSGVFYSLLVNCVLVFIFTQMPWDKNRFDMIMKTYVVAAAGFVLALAMTGNLEDATESGRLGHQLFGNANIFAIMLMMGALYSIWLILSTNKKLIKFLSVLALIIIYYGMFLSGGRKYIIVPIIFLYVLLLHKRDNNNKVHFIRKTLIVFGVVYALYLLMMKVPFLYETIGFRFEEVFNLFADDKSADGSTIKRLLMIEAGFKEWLKSPLIGYGLDSFKYFNKESVTGKFYYSHNNFIELLFNQGVIGFVAYYSFYVYLLRKAFKLRGNELNKGFIVAIVISFLFCEFFSIAYTATPVQFALFFCMFKSKSNNVEKIENLEEVLNE